MPPPESRYSASGYPKEAFRDRDTSLIRKIDPTFTPAKGGPGGPGGAMGPGPGMRP